MLGKREHFSWILDKNREYRSEIEKKFFETIENPPDPSESLIEMVKKFGKFAK